SGTAPSGTAPSGTAPSGTAPSGTAPSGTAPSGTAESAEPDQAAGDEGRIIWLGVASHFRRRGIGSRLLDLALDAFRSRPLGRATLLVDGTQIEALALFRKAGFETEGQTIGLRLPADACAALAKAERASPAGAAVRALALADVSLLGGLLIQLGVERAADPHDDLPALTPAQVEEWLQRPATVGYAAWEAADPQAPVGLAWATRRPDDAVLRFVGVQEDERRQGIGRVLLGMLVDALAKGAEPGERGGPARFRPLRTQLNDPGPEQEFFRHLGFEAEGVTYRLGRNL
ncbi:MAG: GNAT family N-acetyltransferase, partial [Chloroflexota bacterium]